MSSVFITQEVEGRNFFPARRYGTLVPLLPSNAQVVFSSEPVTRKIKRALSKFSDKDFLLLSGDPIIMGLSMMVAAEMNRGYMKLLKWDKHEKDYYEVVVDFFNKKGENNG